MSLGTDQVLLATQAASAISIARREDLYWALHAALVTRREQRALFEQAFELFWRDPSLRRQQAAMAALLPSVTAAPRRDPTLQRLRDAWRAHAPGSKPAPPRPAPEERVDAIMTYSDLERLRHRDFAQMTAAELRAAADAIARMRLRPATITTRRLRPRARGPQLDLRRTLRASVRAGGDQVPLRWRAPARIVPPMVALCDISGSMQRYTRMLLHFLHALGRGRRRLHVFVFGTRLCNITRSLRERDVDHALARVGRQVEDWSGGTRIGACLRAFNLEWSRRVLGQRAVVLLITDGLDRGHGERAGELAIEAARLRRACARLVWLNPLLRFKGFEPRARGVTALLPNVDEHRPVHDLASLGRLAAALRGL
ncbi:MAG: VWA domain-containing protein [Myxococcales bacterium]|nr:VWA domain-containing protein [Myxococcales bacterium]